jgi:hypothetical protein
MFWGWLRRAEREEALVVLDYSWIISSNPIAVNN